MEKKKIIDSLASNKREKTFGHLLQKLSKRNILQNEKKRRVSVVFFQTRYFLSSSAIFQLPEQQILNDLWALKNNKMKKFQRGIRDVQKN